MSSNRHQRIQELFLAALEQAVESRPAFLAEAAGDDLDLRREVESLLDASQRGSALLTAPEATPHPMPDPDPPSPRRVGPYELLHELGRGGMGSVYVARRADESYQRRVAVKLVRPGMDSEAVLTRFRTERQILAALNHPNIARLLDGGSTDDGRPYLVMEYVEGQPIDQYCARMGLAVAERVQLFRTVCAAVSHAHRNLVVHRDLKPANILVTADGTPKLLDFGIAKLLNPDLTSAPGAPTVAALRLMTPEYASPEQARGELVTTASDVYSLGVVLYELLAGCRPYELEGLTPADLERTISESVPPLPSQAALRRTRPAGASDRGRRSRDRLPADLDNIVMMALRKEPQRRYHSVDQLADDLRRYLEHQPVRARRVTWGYAARKFVRRNRLAVAATATAGVALLLSLLATLWQARTAAAERDRVAQLLTDVRGLTNTLIFEFHDAIEKLAGATPARELVVRRALAYLDRLAKDHPRNPALQLELAAAYERLGNIQWARYYANLGDLAGAVESHHKALAIREQVAAAHPDLAEARRALGWSLLNVGDALVELGRLSEGLARYRQSLEIRETLAAGPGATRADRFNLAVAHQRLGDLLGNPGMTNLGDYDGALAHFLKMQAEFQALAASPEATIEDRHSVGIGFEKLGRVAAAKGDQEQALAYYRRELEVFRASHAADSGNARYTRDLAVGLGNVGDALAGLGRPGEAMKYYEEGLGIRAALAAADPRNLGAVRDLALMERAIGSALRDQGRLRPAHERLVRAVRGLARVNAADPANRWIRRQLAATRFQVAAAARQLGDAVEGRSHGIAALQLLRGAAAAPDATAQDLNELAEALLSAPFPELRNAKDAVVAAEEAVARSQGGEARFLATLARAYQQAGAPERAMITAERALALAAPGTPERAALEASLAVLRAPQREFR